MKKTIVLIAVLLSMSCITSVQAQAYAKGNKLLNAGIGFGSFYWGTGYSSGVNPSVSLEYGVSDNISVGGVFTYSGATYKYSDDYKIKYSGKMIGARGSYHFPLNGEIGNKLDPYAGLTLGAVIVSVKDKSDDEMYNYSFKAGGLGYGLHGGARYYLGNNIGIYGELGYTSFAILNLGLTVRF